MSQRAGRAAGIGRIVGAACVALSALAAPAEARADAVDVPWSCPEGTYGDGCHGGEYCAVRECTDDGDCAEGLGCRAVDLCMGETICGHRDVIGHCADLESCDDCELHRVCATGGDADDHLVAGCGCRATTGRGTVSAVGLALVALSALVVSAALRRR